MEHLFARFLEARSLPVLFLIMAVCIYALSRGADWLVEEAVLLSRKWGIPKLLIGATVVSLGTTLPEAAVSVFAAIEGKPDIALGNAVGSIICDTGLILGIATLISPLPLSGQVVHRQGWLQLGAGFLLVAACIPLANPGGIFSRGGVLPRYMGVVFLGLLAVYMWISVKWVKSGGSDESEEGGELPDVSGGGTLLKIVFSIGLVVISSRLLIPAVQETAIRLSVPESIIGATLVAFGTSLPELVTAVTAVRKGHGELAVGNVIGADILNVLFVAGASAAVTPEGLLAPPHFFKLLFPSMLAVLLLFRVGIHYSGERLKRPFGAALLGLYLALTLLSYSGLIS